MFRNWIKQKERHRKTSSVSFALVFSALFLTLGFAVAKVPLKSGVQYTVVADLPKTMFFDQAYTLRVDSKNPDAVPYEVQAAITITGPEGLNDRDMLVEWVTYDKDWNVLTRFILGRDGTQHFSGEGAIAWTGTGTIMMPGDYRIHLLNVTVLGSAPVGEYEAIVTVVGEEKPIEPIEAALALSCDSSGTPKDTFQLAQPVYVKGSGYLPSRIYDLYLVNATDWVDGMAIPQRIPATATTVTSDSSGNIPATIVWSPELKPGKYDIVVDVNGDGFYNASIDALDKSNVTVNAGFFVIPEYWGTIMGLIACLVALAVFRISRRNIPLRKVTARLLRGH